MRVIASLPRTPNQTCALSLSLRGRPTKLPFDRMIYRAKIPPAAMRFCGRARVVIGPDRSFVSLSLRQPGGAARSGNERTALLLLHFVRGARRSRQLQHRRVLAFAQSGEQNDLSVGKLQCVVVHRRLLICRNRANLSATFWFGKSEWQYSTSVSNATSVPGRRHTATVGSSTAANPRVTELLNFVRHQLVADLCRLGCDEV